MPAPSCPARPPQWYQKPNVEINAITIICRQNIFVKRASDTMLKEGITANVSPFASKPVIEEGALRGAAPTNYIFGRLNQGHAVATVHKQRASRGLLGTPQRESGRPARRGDMDTPKVQDTSTGVRGWSEGSANCRDFPLMCYIYRRKPSPQTATPCLHEFSFYINHNSPNVCPHQ
jgi:hypothetical protein